MIENPKQQRQVNQQRRKQGTIDLKSCRWPTCPYCFHEHTGDQDGVFVGYHDGADADVTCQKCEETFHCFVSYHQPSGELTYTSFFISDIGKLRKGLEFIRDEMTKLRDKPEQARIIALNEAEKLLETELFWED